MRGPDPLRLLIIVALTATVGVKLLFWLNPEDVRRQPAALRGTASVAGFVIDDRGEPVVDARIRAVMRGAGGWYQANVTTGPDGAFTLTDVPAGQLSLRAGHDAYVRRAQGDPVDAYVEVDEGQQFREIRLLMARGGSISGRAVDASGAPIANRMVRAYRRDDRRDGSVTLRGLPGSGTDERGEYRIDGLVAGEYYVTVSLSSDPIASVFHPSAISLDEAIAVAVEPGGAVRDIDITGRDAPRSRLDGRLDRQGQDVHPTMVTLIKPAPGSGHRVTVPDADGRFSLENLPAGTYWLIAYPAADGPTPHVAPWAVRRVTIDGISPAVVDRLAMSPGVAVAGRVDVDGVAPGPEGVPAWMLGLRPLDERTAAVFFTGAVRGAEVDAGGAFTFGSLPDGRYELAVNALDGLWPLSVEIDGEARPGNVFEIRSGTGPSNIRVTLTKRPTRLNGHLVTETGEAASGRLVFAFPNDERLWRFDRTSVAVDVADSDGTFRMLGLLPGNYLVASVTGFSDATPELLRSLRAQATPVSLAAGETRSLTVIASPDHNRK